MNLDQIYQPIADDLKKVEHFLEFSVKESKNRQKGKKDFTTKTLFKAADRNYRKNKKIPRKFAKRC